MQTITINAPGGPIDALLSVPDGKGPWPGVVLVHDAIGYGPDNERISREVAAAGYIAITPNMFARGGMARCVTRVMRELLTKRGRALDDILAARDHLLALPQASGAVGIAGFCMGGQFALVMSPKGFGASAPFYGTPLPRDLSETLDGACPDRGQLRPSRPDRYRRGGQVWKGSSTRKTSRPTSRPTPARATVSPISFRRSR